MVHDFWMYRDDPAFVRAQLPERARCSTGSSSGSSPNGLLGRIPWWAFVDWANDFPAGVPPQEKDGQSAPITLQLVAALRDAADLEAAFGDAQRAQLYREKARAAADAVLKLCWDEARGMVADRPSKDRFSQQTNVLAILTDAVPAERQPAVLDRVLAAGMPSAKDLETPAGENAAQKRPTQASYYFRFYLSRALDKLGRGDSYLPSSSPGARCCSWGSRPSPRRRSTRRARTATPGARTRTTTC